MKNRKTLKFKSLKCCVIVVCLVMGTVTARSQWDDSCPQCTEIEKETTAGDALEAFLYNLAEENGCVHSCETRYSPAILRCKGTGSVLECMKEEAPGTAILQTGYHMKHCPLMEPVWTINDEPEWTGNRQCWHDDTMCYRG